MSIFDITVPLNSTLPAWPGESGFTLNQQQQDYITVSSIQMGVHNGTHIDAPLHFLPEGSSIEELNPELLIGPVRVCEIEHPEIITAEELKKLNLDGCQRVIFKSANSRSRWFTEPFNQNFVALSSEAAHWIVAQGIKLVGIDYLSIEKFNGDHSVHKSLLKANVIILEGLNLCETPPGDYILFCAPLKIEGGEGAPARALLLSPDHLEP